MTWLVSVIRLLPLAVGLPGLWRAQDHAAAGEHGTTTVLGWRAAGAPVFVAGGASVAVAADAAVPAAAGMPASVEAGRHRGRGRSAARCGAAAGLEGRSLGRRSAWCISDRDLLCCAIAAFKWDRPWVVLFWVGGRASKG